MSDNTHIERQLEKIFGRLLIPKVNDILLGNDYNIKIKNIDVEWDVEYAPKSRFIHSNISIWLIGDKQKQPHDLILPPFFTSPINDLCINYTKYVASGELMLRITYYYNGLSIKTMRWGTDGVVETENTSWVALSKSHSQPYLRSS